MTHFKPVPAQEIIDEARNGRMFILIDSDETGGDLVLPAQMTTPDAITFMARHGRGLICLALPRSRAAELQLGLQSPGNSSRDDKFFTVSIEAKVGVETGISAADRARTILTAIDVANGPGDLVSPGHVFPIVAREGGVLIRSGHTEAAVDIARLAGLVPAGVICAIMDEHGGRAGRDYVACFAQGHGLKVGTIADLVAYRLRHDHLVERLEQSEIVSEWGGRWTMIKVWNKALAEGHIVLQKGDVDPDRPTLVRIHALSPAEDIFGGQGERRSLLSRAMQLIGDEGRGILVLLGRPLVERPSSDSASGAGRGDPASTTELRDYGVGAMILAELGVHNIVLLSNKQPSPIGLEGFGLSIIGRRAF
jgi:3,4-dihydroxy 2-butanone 4-phosphate synthase/GTP cyclohydrolase II